jgi:hypothetical protein
MVMDLPSWVDGKHASAIAISYVVGRVLQVVLGEVAAPGAAGDGGGGQCMGSGLALLPPASRTPLLAAVAAPLVYYATSPQELQVGMGRGGDPAMWQHNTYASALCSKGPYVYGLW